MCCVAHTEAERCRRFLAATGPLISINPAPLGL
jgi:hypothetical protein